MKNNLVYLKHILESVEKIEVFLRGVERNNFLKNALRISAVVRELEIIGEAATKVSVAFREKYSEIPWREMKRTRNFLIHQYFAVDVKEVWKTVKVDIPQLKKAVEKVLESFDC